MKRLEPLEILIPGLETALKGEGGLVKLFTSGGSREARARVLFEFYKTNVLISLLASSSSTANIKQNTIK